MMTTLSNPTILPHHSQQYPHQLHTHYNHYTNRRQQQSISTATPTTSSQDFSFPAVVNNSTIDTLPDDPMQSEHWGSTLAPYPSGKMNRATHQRESSLSSLGSTGPASPYNHTTSNPQIAVTDSGSDGLSEMHGADNSNSHNGGGYYQLAKPLSGGSYSGYHNMDGISDMAYPVTIPGPNASNMNTKPRTEQRNALLPAPDFAGNSKSHPASVASSVAGDSPATPTMNEAELVDKRRKAGYGDVPNLDRTLTDIYGDELFNPNFTITSTPPSQPAVSAPNVEVFRQRLSAANTHHLNDGHSPASSVSGNLRASPFRAGSPHALLINNHDTSGQRSLQFNSAQRMREHAKAQQDAQAYQQQQACKNEPETPKTISPKDAMLEFNEPEGDTQFAPLFPTETNNFNMGSMSKLPMTTQAMQPQPSGHQLGYLGPMPVNFQLTPQFPYLGRSPNGYSPPRLSSAGSSESTGSMLQRPMNTTADSGTYTCTYHGCTLRFETPALLQKHKREGHRQTQGLGRPHELSGMATSSNLVGTQSGPHRCDRINPSTGKPCNTVFSRPYDLTRHEDTIHNARKQKVRCNLCTEEKTFSRADALTRHYRVCHPDQELPGKHRRRGPA